MKALQEEVCGKAEQKGRECVGESLQKLQRLVMQLDRSDGRRDIKTHEIAERYIDAIGTCFRTGERLLCACMACVHVCAGMWRRDIKTHEVAERDIDAIGTCFRTGERLLCACMACVHVCRYV